MPSSSPSLTSHHISSSQSQAHVDTQPSTTSVTTSTAITSSIPPKPNPIVTNTNTNNADPTPSPTTTTATSTTILHPPGHPSNPLPPGHTLTPLPADMRVFPPIWMPLLASQPLDRPIVVPSLAEVTEALENSSDNDDSDYNYGNWNSSSRYGDINVPKGRDDRQGDNLAFYDAGPNPPTDNNNTYNSSDRSAFMNRSNSRNNPNTSALRCTDDISLYSSTSSSSSNTSSSSARRHHSPAFTASLYQEIPPDSSLHPLPALINLPSPVTCLDIALCPIDGTRIVAAGCHNGLLRLIVTPRAFPCDSHERPNTAKSRHDSKANKTLQPSSDPTQPFQVPNGAEKEVADATSLPPQSSKPGVGDGSNQHRGNNNADSSTTYSDDVNDSKHGKDSAKHGPDSKGGNGNNKADNDDGDDEDDADDDDDDDITEVYNPINLHANPGYCVVVQRMLDGPLSSIAIFSSSATPHRAVRHHLLMSAMLQDAANFHWAINQRDRERNRDENTEKETPSKMRLDHKVNRSVKGEMNDNNINNKPSIVSVVEGYEVKQDEEKGEKRGHDDVPPLIALLRRACNRTANGKPSTSQSTLSSSSPTSPHAQTYVDGATSTNSYAFASSASSYSTSSSSSSSTSQIPSISSLLAGLSHDVHIAVGSSLGVMYTFSCVQTHLLDLSSVVLESDMHDAILCITIADTDNDGRHEILAGTYGCRVLCFASQPPYSSPLYPASSPLSVAYAPLLLPPQQYNYSLPDPYQLSFEQYLSPQAYPYHRHTPTAPIPFFHSQYLTHSLSPSSLTPSSTATAYPLFDVHSQLSSISSTSTPSPSSSIVVPLCASSPFPLTFSLAWSRIVPEPVMALRLLRRRTLITIPQSQAPSSLLSSTSDITPNTQTTSRDAVAEDGHGALIVVMQQSVQLLERNFVSASSNLAGKLTLLQQIDDLETLLDCVDTLSKLKKKKKMMKKKEKKLTKIGKNLSL